MKRDPILKARLTRLVNKLKAANTVEKKRKIIARILEFNPPAFTPRTTGTKRNPLSFAELVGVDGTDEQAVAQFIAGTIPPGAASLAEVRRQKTARRSATGRKAAQKTRKARVLEDNDQVLAQLNRLRAQYRAKRVDEIESAGNIVNPDTVERGFVHYAARKMNKSESAVRKYLKMLP